MSASKGDDGLWTLEELYAATEKTLALPALSAALGRPVTLTVRRISTDEHRACLPGLPPESETWGSGITGDTPEAARTREQEFLDRQVAWLQALPEEDIEARRRARARAAYRILAVAAIRPALSVADAERFGDEATGLAVEVLRFSELLKSPTPDGPGV